MVGCLAVGKTGKVQMENGNATRGWLLHTWMPTPRFVLFSLLFSLFFFCLLLFVRAPTSDRTTNQPSQPARSMCGRSVQSHPTTPTDQAEQQTTVRQLCILSVTKSTFTKLWAHIDILRD